MRRAAGTAVAGMAAMVCAALLAGCQGHAAASQSVSNVVTPSASSVVTPSVTPSGTSSAADSASVDSQLNAVDGQLSGLDSAMAQATQSPSDGG